MGTGYTRNDTGNNIADGNIINASDLDGEFDAVESAFNSSTGHTHDGTSAEGGPITKLGPVQDLVVSASAVTPKTDNTLDLGSSSLEFKDGFFDGTVNIDSLVADTADINGGSVDGVTIGTNSAVTDLRVDNIKVDGNTISSTDTNGNVTVDPNGSGQINLSANVDVTGTVTFDGGTTSADLNFGDNVFLKIGTGNDLQLYHTGTHSYIDDLGTGDLNIRATSALNLASPTGDTYATFGQDGAATLFFDNAAKLATTSTGVDVTGTVTADNVTMTSDDPTITMTDSSGTNDIATIQATSGALIVTARDGSADGEIIFKKTDGSATDETLRITSGGNVGIGTDSPQQLLSLKANNPGGKIRLEMGQTGVANNDVTGEIQFYHNDSSGAGVNADIKGICTSGVGAGALTFGTGTTSTTERLRITNSGDVLINTTSILGDGKLSIAAPLNSRCASTMKNTATQSGGQTYIRFLNNADAIAGSIQHTGTTTVNYGTSSDYRLKENVADMTGAIDRVKALAPKRFNFISDADTTVDGFLAHEAQAVVPEAVTGTHNEVKTWTQQQIDDGDAPDGTSAGDNRLDGDGNTIPVMQGIDQSKLVPLLTGALREAIAKIEDLETRLAALEGA
jgi:hypothetical protein